MDDTLSFSESSKKLSATEWHLGTESDISLGAGSARFSLQQDLHVLSTKELKSKKPFIPASLIEKLSFLSAYTSTSSKIEILCMQQNDVNRFFWLYISNLLCKSLPMTYAYVFLSSYAPDHHLYISKIMPLCYGFNWFFVISSIFQLLIMIDNTILYFVYFIRGILFKVPWNRCFNTTIYLGNDIYNCYNLLEFSTKFNDTNVTYETFFYKSPTEKFSVAQIEYFDIVLKDLIEIKLSNLDLYLFPVLWIFAVLNNNELFKKRIWKLLNYSHIALCMLLFIICMHIVITYENKPIVEIQQSDVSDQEYLMGADFDLLAESMTAPPIIHVLIARGTDEIRPNFDSGIITTSNGLLYIYKALTSYLLKKYCNRWVNGTIIYWRHGSGSRFYLWPIYFATVDFGDFFVLIFFALNAIVDYCTFLVTFYCVVETIHSEWKWIKKWWILVAVLIAALTDRVITYFFAIPLITESCFLFWTGVSTLAEIIILFWMYPLSRLVDDITFHYGVPPTKLRVLNFRILPIFYSIKIYIMFDRFFTISETDLMFGALIALRSSLLIHFILFCSGIIVAIYYYVYKQKKSWGQLFKPLPEWGPKDFFNRQLRKQFDSREFIASQAPRNLSRHLISKAQLKAYKVDVDYDIYNRRPTFQTENNEKIL